MYICQIHRLATASTVAIWAFCLGVFLTVGCGQSQPVNGSAANPTSSNAGSSVQPASYRNGDAESFLKAVFNRYRSATSYHDRGQVRLTTTENGKRLQRIAPMAMWLDRSDMDLIAYDVRIAVEDSVLQAWVVDSATSDFDSQVLTQRLRPGRGRPAIDQAMADPILAQRLGSGLAGPPPQLEWLFEADPMKSLFAGDQQFDVLADDRIDGHHCRCIQVVDGADEYRFYVDAKRYLIRQVDLPRILGPAADGSTKEISLRIELTDASFDPPARRSLRDGFPKSPKLVDRFIPLPAIEPPKILGTRGPSSTSIQRQAGTTVVISYTGDAASLISLSVMDAWQRSLPKPSRQKVDVIVACDQSSEKPTRSMTTLPIAIDADHDIADKLRLKGGVVAVLDRQGQIAWWQPTVDQNTMPSLIAIVADVIEGIDVPARIRQQWKQQNQQYRQKLGKHFVQ